MHNMQKLLFIILSIFLCSLPIQAQVKEISKFEIIADFFKLDKLGNFYFIKKNILEKKDKNNNLLMTYDNYSFGNISNVSVTDPLRILLFYQDFNRLIYLNNDLSELRDPISLDDIELYSITAVCPSSNGGFWLYNTQNSQVINVNKDLKSQINGVNLYSVIGDSHPLEIFISINYIYVWLDSKDVIVLDKFGNYYALIKSKNSNAVCIDNDILYLLEDGTVRAIDVANMTEQEISLPKITILDFEISGQYIYVLSDNSLITFEIL